MPVVKGKGKPIKQIKIGKREIKKVYKGSVLVYESKNLTK